MVDYRGWRIALTVAHFAIGLRPRLVAPPQALGAPIRPREGLATVEHARNRPSELGSWFDELARHLFEQHNQLGLEQGPARSNQRNLLDTGREFALSGGGSALFAKGLLIL